jgi:hypothetical protein
MIRGTRILFISVKFFGYYNDITEKMRSMGAIVDYYDERPTNSFIVKALIRINRKLLFDYINNYHLQIIERTKHNNYSYVFIIKGEALSKQSLFLLQKYHLKAKFILCFYNSSIFS